MAQQEEFLESNKAKFVIYGAVNKLSFEALFAPYPCTYQFWLVSKSMQKRLLLLFTFCGNCYVLIRMTSLFNVIFILYMCVLLIP